VVVAAVVIMTLILILAMRRLSWTMLSALIFAYALVILRAVR
jgi:hypothetical protein